MMNNQATTVFLSLGSNVGDKRMNLFDAIHAIENIPQTFLLKSSKIWETGAWGKTDQADFYNMAISINTTHSPELLIETLIEIEEKIGRVRIEKWGPRLIDIDILFYGDLVLKTEKLIIPHPEIQNRKFVLAPLNEICPAFVHPVYKKTVADLFVHCDDNSAVSVVIENEI